MKHLRNFENFKTAEAPVNEGLFDGFSDKKIAKTSEFFTKNAKLYPTNKSEFEKYLAFYNENIENENLGKCGDNKIKMFKDIVRHVSSNDEAKFQLPIKFDAITDENCDQLILRKAVSYSSGAGIGGDGGHKK